MIVFLRGRRDDDRFRRRRRRRGDVLGGRCPEEKQLERIELIGPRTVDPLQQPERKRAKDKPEKAMERQKREYVELHPRDLTWKGLTEDDIFRYIVDLSLFDDTARLLGRVARRSLSDLVYKVRLANANAFFGTPRGNNDAGAPTALCSAERAPGIAKMKTQRVDEIRSCEMHCPIQKPRKVPRALSLCGLRKLGLPPKCRLRLVFHRNPHFQRVARHVQSFSTA